MKIIDLRSDTVTRPSKGMREFIASAEVGDDVFGDDPTVKNLEDRTAEVLGHEAALFVPSGTMANQVSLRALAMPGDEIICETGAHIFNYEVAGAAAISGIQLHPIGAANGILTSEIVEPLIRPEDIHDPRTAAIAIENSNNRAGGTVFPMEVIGDLRRLADQYKVKLYLDGARLWNAATYLGVKPSEIASKFDYVSVCFSKGLGAPIGSAIVSSRENIKKARRIRKMYGGGMRQVGLIAAGALYALENNYTRLGDDHKRAANLARLLSKSPFFLINPDTIQTNIVVIRLASGLNPDRFCQKLSHEKVLVVPFGENMIRAVAHLDVDDTDIEKAANIMLETADSPA